MCARVGRRVVGAPRKCIASTADPLIGAPRRFAGSLRLKGHGVSGHPSAVPSLRPTRRPGTSTKRISMRRVPFSDAPEFKRFARNDPELLTFSDPKKRFVS